MTTRDIFDGYFQFRSDRANALTPGKKLALVEDLLAEAKQGRVPVGNDTVSVLPIESPSVQAVLNGEALSMGSARVSGKLEGTAALIAKAQALPRSQQMLLSVAFIVVLALFGGGGMWLMTRDRNANAATPTPTPNATPDPRLLLADSDPSRKANDPASLEVGLTSFVLGRSRLDGGVWEPIQAEWLDGTQVRRVIAIPRDELDKSVEIGQVLRVRTRSGMIVPYEVVEKTTLQRTQIEALSSLEPSLVVILYDNTAAATREVVIARLDTNEMGIAISDNVYLVDGPVGEINLRERPYGAVIGVLKTGTIIEVLDDEPVHDGGYLWVRVKTNFGAEGWVASELLNKLPDY